MTHEPTGCVGRTLPWRHLVFMFLHSPFPSANFFTWALCGRDGLPAIWSVMIWITDDTTRWTDQLVDHSSSQLIASWTLSRFRFLPVRNTAGPCQIQLFGLSAIKSKVQASSMGGKVMISVIRICPPFSLFTRCFFQRSFDVGCSSRP